MYDKVSESVRYIECRMNLKPKIAVILGSGLGDLADAIENKEYINYKDIPNFPQSTVVGHEGRLVLGEIKGVAVLAMQGRFHYFEGYTMKEVAYPVFVMKLLGIEKLIVTNACGGINTSFSPGTLMIITDFINLVSDNPLIGINDERFGPRFPDMSEPYKLELIDKAKKVAGEIGVEYREGIYAGFMGPYYETAAEIRAIGGQGADAVGMSTVPETIAANYLGIEVLGISCITNMATGIQKQKHSHARVIEIAKKASVDFCRWVAKIIEDIG
ncbi:purine-nucleoside phosphorylase [Clostridium tagluense]|uniref:purine-nucleoside phosphorylase n=1 Tax=Clostridium tagluense TaxID=360422 RepID=UPI001C6F5ACD|nr:purine-nucleoside phosphorylase [Clostridium tagluense]MBW9157375.1 purine-nucleoside phosphorylase [Clostridium tagluense]WLC67865.1 purine-nucleoside phosphorylase [Clostridium tagluense]